MKTNKNIASMPASQLSAMIFTIELGRKLQAEKADSLRAMREGMHLSMRDIANKLALERRFRISNYTARQAVQYALSGYKGDSKIANTEPYEGIVSDETNHLVKKELQAKSLAQAMEQSIGNKRSGFYTMTQSERVKNGKKSIISAYPDRIPYSANEEKVILKCLQNPQKYSVKSGGNKGKIDASRISKILHRLGYKRESQHITKAIPKIARRHNIK